MLLCRKKIVLLNWPSIITPCFYYCARIYIGVISSDGGILSNPFPASSGTVINLQKKKKKSQKPQEPKIAFTTLGFMLFVGDTKESELKLQGTWCLSTPPGLVISPSYSRS